MFGPVEDLILHFEYDDDRKKQFYFPGETLRGTILVRIRRRLRVRKITMHIFGGAAVSWEIPNKKKIYSAQEEYIQGTKHLMDSGAEDSVAMEEGTHKFSFFYRLPSTLPSSFSGVYGSVSYLVKVVLEPEDGVHTITSEPFLVLRRPPLAIDLFTDREMKTSKNFVSLLAVGKIKIKCKISQAAAIPGETIYVNAEVTNWSPRGISLIQAAIILESTYCARNSDKKIVFRQILNKRIDVFDVRLRRGRRWRNVQMDIPPYLPDSNLEGCSIMDVKYLFEYRVQIEGKDDLVVQTLLTVGGYPTGYNRLTMASKMNRASEALSLSEPDLPGYVGHMRSLTETVDGDEYYTGR